MATVGTACASVKLCRREFSAARETRPYATTAMARRANTPPTRRSWRRGAGWPGFRSGGDIGSSEVGFRRRLWAVVPVNNTYHHRDEEERGGGGEDQAADHGAAERRILLAAFAQAERHRQHADHHRQRRHHHRAQAHESGLERGLRRIAALVELFA